MFDLLLEGVESIRLPCSWVILIAATAVFVYARGRSALTMASFGAAVAAVAWLRFAGWWFDSPSGVVQIAVGVAIVVTASFAWREDLPVFDIGLGALTGAVSTWAWIPCVGEHLATVINGARSEPFAHIAGMIAFTVGLLLPFIVLAAVELAVPEIGKVLRSRRLAFAGSLLVAAFGVLYATTLLDDLSSELARRSSF